MHSINAALLASLPIVLGSQTVFSVHDDILAFPQYEIIFSDSFISDTAANLIAEQASSPIPHPPQSSITKSIESPNSAPHAPQDDRPFDPSHETYELMYLNGEQHLCTIPIVEIPPKNETSEAEARAAEQKELARATDRGWELLQALEGDCLYYISGWWSYAFCYNADITQFHQLPPQPGKPLVPPIRDRKRSSKVKGRGGSKEDEWGNRIDAPKGQKAEPPKTELQVKGDSRYLVQTMEGGTTCDLTGKPRRVEVQYHCNPHVTDRVGYIKEVTTCSYLMVVYTPRLCNDVAFLPPKENKAHPIVCRVVVPEDELAYREQLKTLEAELEASQKTNKKINIGGVEVGGGHWMNKDGARLPIPPNFGQEPLGSHTQVIAKAKSKVDGGQVEMISDAELAKMDLDPEMVEQLRKEVQKMAAEKGWKIEVVDAPGEIREILGIVDNDDKEDDVTAETIEGEAEGDEGSEEIFKDEL
ncbi:Protein OS-9-like protein [Lachnellula suecica]|uniref:Endoplasmic reticulum lectin n=1 Tax=Lachnellula suecica TaxID=602035 RepID=A0A8T9CA56_9HELO|nr:Protein OS-9-like protein [Lachnellula suecica]